MISNNSMYRHFFSRISLLLLFYLLAITMAFAQKNLQPGLIVTLSKDTLHGFIDYRNWGKNPAKIDFYRSEKDVATVYSPLEIESFRVSDETYNSAIVTIDDSPFKTEDLREEMVFNYLTDTVFLLNLVDGEKNLYFFMDIKGKEHFFIKNNSAYELLLYKRYLKRDEVVGLSIAQYNKYVGQLHIYLQDCSSIQSKLDDLKYARKNLVNLFLYYYECSKKKMVSQNKAVSHPYEFGVLAGCSITKLKFTSGMDYFSKANYPLSKKFSAGLFLNIVFPRNFGRVALSNELLYYPFKTECFYNNAVKTSIGLHYIMINNMILYKYPLYKVNLFLKSGTSFGIGFSETNNQKFEETTFQSASEAKAFSELNKLYLGINLGVGLKFRKYSIEAKYIFGFKKWDYLVVNTAVNSRTSSGSLMLGYQF
jgi:hypothetical protein